VISDGLNWNSLIGGLALIGILSVLGYAALAQGSHDALVALISLVTGVGIGAGTVSQKAPSVVTRSVIPAQPIAQPQRPFAPESTAPATPPQTGG
jgi:hypothetical protein